MVGSKLSVNAVACRVERQTDIFATATSTALWTFRARRETEVCDGLVLVFFKYGKGLVDRACVVVDEYMKPKQSRGQQHESTSCTLWIQKGDRTCRSLPRASGVRVLRRAARYADSICYIRKRTCSLYRLMGTWQQCTEAYEILFFERQARGVNFAAILRRQHHVRTSSLWELQKRQRHAGGCELLRPPEDCMC